MPASKAVPFFLVGTVVGLVFLAAALWLLFNGHPHEDAYILYTYVRNVATGHGIVFDATSGHAEGATDFLWMVALACLYKVGLAPAYAAAILNSIGLVTIAYTLLRFHGRLDAFSGVALLLVVASGGTAAALGGFSTLAYGGLMTLFFFALHQRRNGQAVFLGLVISFFRPDGVLVALGGLGTLFLLATRDERRKMLVPLAMSFGIGLAYFLWRYAYFGLLLPLPLIVKAQTDNALGGLGQNLMAINFYAFLLVPLLYLCAKGSVPEGHRRTVLAIAMSAIALFVGLLFAHQSQNVGFRFQFPLILAVIMLFLVAAQKQQVFSRVAWLAFLTVLPALIICQNGYDLVRVSRTMQHHDAINYLPQRLKTNGFAVDRIAITEAGRFPYWYSAPTMVDLIGLNSPRILSKGMRATLEEEQPELIFVHHAGRYDLSSFDSGADFVVLSPDALTLLPAESRNPVKRAPEVVLDYARERGYTAIAVRYLQRLDHVYFLAPTLDKALFLRSLEESLTIRPTYAESERSLSN